MAYVLLFLGDRQQVICTPSGRTILRREDGTSMVAEDDYHCVFPNPGAALCCAREVAGDPDLRALTEM
jgi:hypothetical protein